MRLPILIVSIWALANAKPEMYREKEDFQYSRSSSDDGSKSGFYGAQRGNMGGNYERAHNMDLLAQNQMSTLVRQVDGDLGTGAKDRTGSVFTSGSSRGVYGSGNYDLSNLKGRNFNEAESYGDSQSQSSMSSNSGFGSHSFASNNARYSSSQAQNSRHSSSAGYTAGHISPSLVINAQQAQRLHSGVDNEFGSQSSNGYKYYSQIANEQNSDYEQNVRNAQSSSGSNMQTRVVSGTPVKVYIRPGTRVTVPIAAQTYDASQLSSINDQNLIASDAELLSNSGQTINLKPVTKHYESSYNYRKEWEKHDTQPVLTPTENPFPINSELYDNRQRSQDMNIMHQDSLNTDIGRSHRVNAAYAGGYNAESQSSASQNSRFNSGYTAESQNAASGFSGSRHSSDFLLQNNNIGDESKLNSVVDDINSRPKSYHSSYSYHKAWERQGDPYVIKPISSGAGTQTSQRLSSSGNYGYGSHNSQAHQSYGSHHSHAHQSYSKGGALSEDCDENGHVRVARSYNTDQFENNHRENFDQQSQSEWANLEDLGQRTQNSWGSLDNLGQQTQNNWDNLENLSQQTQNTFDKIENSGQESQNTWENFENLGQQEQNQWGNLEDLGQQIENKDNNQNLEQQTQNMWGKLENLGQQSQDESNKKVNSEQETQTFDKVENFRHEIPSNLGKLDDLGQQTQNTWDKLDNLGQQMQNTWDNLGQQTQNSWDNLGQEAQNSWDNLGQETLSQWHNLDRENSESQNKRENLGQETQNQWDNLHHIGQETQSNWHNLQNQQTQMILGHQHQKENVDTETSDNLNTQYFNTKPQENTNIFEQNSGSFFKHEQQQHSYGYQWSHNEQANNFNDNYWQHQLNTNHQQDTSNNDLSKLNNFWDKLDKIAETLPSQTNNEFGNDFSNSQSDWKETDNTYPGSTDWKPTTESSTSVTHNNKSETSPVQKDQNEFKQDTDDDNKNLIHHQIRPIDVGRGDIGPEDILTELNNHNRHTLTEVTTKKTKSPTEIETLSLTQKEKNELSQDKTQDKETLSVLGLGQNAREDNSQIVNAGNTNEDRFMQQGSENVNKHDYEHPSLFTSSLEQQNLEQIPDGLEQQSMDQFQDLEQMNQDLQSQTLMDFSQQTQTLDNFEQELQSDKSGHSNDFEFNKYSNHNENYQQEANTPQVEVHEHFDKVTKNVDHMVNNMDQKNEKIESDEPPAKNSDTVETPPEVPQEVVTPKPGFWRSVGNKFSSAKDSVVGWFKRG